MILVCLAADHVSAQTQYANIMTQIAATMSIEIMSYICSTRCASSRTSSIGSKMKILARIRTP